MAKRSAGSITISIEALTKELDKGLDSAKKSVGGFNDKMGKVGQGMSDVGGQAVVFGGAMAGAGAGILAGAKMGEQAFATYGQGVAEISSLIPDTGDRIKELDRGIRDVSKELGILPKEATTGMYNLISAFGDSEDSLKLLDINARAAKAGVATLSDSIALTSAVTKTYGDISAEGQKKATDLAFTTVKLGQTTFPELANSIGAVTPLAKDLNVSQEELFATMATLTGVTGGASEVSTQFRGALQALSAPTTEMGKLIKRLGYENGQALVKSKGMAGALKIITDEAKKTDKPLQNFIGSIEGQTLALALTGGQAGKYETALNEMSKASGATDKAFENVTTGAGESAQKLAEQQAQMELARIEMGEALLPITLKLTKTTTDLVSAFSNFVKENPGVVQAIVILGGILLGVGTVITAVGGFLIGLGQIITTVSLIIANWATITTVASAIIGGVIAFLTSPITLVIGAIALLGTAIFLLWKNWDWVVMQISNLWSWLGKKTNQNLNFIAGVFTKHWEWIKGVFQKAWDWITNIVSWHINKHIQIYKTLFTVGKNIFNRIKNTIAKIIKSMVKRVLHTVGLIKSGFQKVPNVVKNVFKKAVSFAQPLINTLNKVGALANGIGSKVSSGVSRARSFIPGFADGGFVGNKGVNISRSNGDNRLITARDDEFVANQSQRDNIFEAIANGGFKGQGGGGQDKNVKIEIKAWDSQSMIDFLKKNAFLLLRILKLN